jgi:hypothetical protein
MSRVEQRGVAQVGKGDTVFATFKEGDYFGEVALLTDQPRTASVVAVTDLMLLSLSCVDLEAVLAMFPTARARIEAAATERLRALAKGEAAQPPATKAYLKGKERRRGSWSVMNSLLLSCNPLQQRRTSLTTAAASHSSSNNMRVSHRLLTLSAQVAPTDSSTPSRTGPGAPPAPYRDPLSDAIDLLPDARRTDGVAYAGEHRRPSLDSRPVGELGEYEANQVCSMPPSMPEKPPRRNSLGETTLGPPSEHCNGEISECGGVAASGGLGRSLMQQARRRLSCCGTRGTDHVSGISSTPNESTKKRWETPSHPSGPEKRRFSACGRRRNVEGVRSQARRHSVDAGLTRIDNPGIMMPGVPCPVPQQWSHLGNSGSSSCRGSEDALRLSIDRGLDSPDDQRRLSRYRRGSETFMPYGLAEWPCGCMHSAPGSHLGSRTESPLHASRFASPERRRPVGSPSHLVRPPTMPWPHDGGLCHSATTSRRLLPSDEGLEVIVASRGQSEVAIPEKSCPEPESMSSADEQRGETVETDRSAVPAEEDAGDIRDAYVPNGPAPGQAQPSAQQQSSTDPKFISARKASLSLVSSWRRRKGSLGGLATNKVAARVAESLSFNRHSLRRCSHGASQSPRSSEISHGASITDRALRAQLKEAISPLHLELSQSHLQQVERLQHLQQTVAGELRRVQEALVRLDGKWM